MINDQQIETIRQQLSQKLEEIQLRLEQDNELIKDKSDLGDDVDRANQEESQQMQLNRRQHDLAQVKSIKDALRRIEEQDYGFCESCGEDINAARLNARPESRYCIDCQDYRERKSSQYA
ncbi:MULTISPECIES: TraR/DksA family transcriptional regulator [unclassified Agarivorans]|uniref:TraR/DksA family transcriptional regulator n=1 Tax=unclassified Agarivorans TaxID=2636026 RepID=UPI003D7E550B